VLVPSGAVSIVQANITDTRLNNNVCGIVHGVVDQVNTTTLFNQYQNYLNSKITEWNATKAQQATDWQAQMIAQQNSFNAQSSTIEEWYTSIQADITRLRGFNFDNLAELTGTTRTTVFNSDTLITETIKTTNGSKLVATRATTFNANGTITVVITILEDDGATVMKQATTTTTFGTNITEVTV
jgi:hypothetical protein